MNEDFRMHLLDKAREFGFAEPKRSQWIQYMLVRSRSEEQVRSLLHDLGIREDQRNRALDIGCGYGNLLRALGQCFQHVHGIEIIEERVEWARMRVPDAEVICGTATKLL